MRITSYTPVKDEGPFILEWLAYHRLIGVTDPVVISNDCTDGSDALLDRLDEMGLVRHLPNPSMMTGTGRHHWTVLDYVNLMGATRRSDWVTCFDLDEFVCVNVGDGTLAALFEAFPEADAISMAQLTFGTGGRRRFEEGLVTEQFTRCEPLVPQEEGRAARRGLKTLTARRAGMERLSNHSPRFDAARAGEVNWINAAGAPMPAEGRTEEIKMLAGPSVAYDAVQLNHYALRSAESFLVQAARGNANHPDKPARMNYWRRHDFNDIENTAIARWHAPLRAEMDRLLQDPELARAQAACVAAHRARIEALKAEDDYAFLWKRTKVVHERTWGPDCTRIAS